MTRPPLSQVSTCLISAILPECSSSRVSKRVHAAHMTDMGGGTWHACRGEGLWWQVVLQE